MAIKFQYNKTSLQQLEKQLKVRVRTLPIIKNKESALRMEVKRCKTEAVELEERLEKQIQAYEAMFALWNEFDASLIKVSDVHLGIKKIAGVRVPLLENVDFDIRPYSLFINHETLETHGAVSEETVIEMVKGAMKSMNSDCAVATSGIAGPTGGTPDKPVGTIWIAAGCKDKVITLKLEGDEGRNKNIANATQNALQLLRKLFQNEENEQ